VLLISISFFLSPNIRCLVPCLLSARQSTTTTTTSSNPEHGVVNLSGGGGRSGVVNPQDRLAFDEASGYYYDPESGLYFDSCNNLFYDGLAAKYYTWDVVQQRFVDALAPTSDKVGKKQLRDCLKLFFFPLSHTRPPSM